MNGASKFVRGDAIAGLLVVFINVIGGMIIGIAQQGLSFADAAHSYTILTVGDPFQDSCKVADRYAFSEQNLQNTLDA